MPAKRLTALLVVSDPVQRDVIALALRRLDMNVVSTGLESQVRALVQTHRPAVLVIDAFLPDTNGIDLLRELRDAGALGETGVILISALGFREVVQQAVDAGAHYFLVKPVDTDLLIKRVQDVLVEVCR